MKIKNIKKCVFLAVGTILTVGIIFSGVYAMNVKKNNIDLDFDTKLTTNKTIEQLNQEYENLLKQNPKTTEEAEQLYQEELKLKQEFIAYANQNKNVQSRNATTISKEDLALSIESQLAALENIIQGAKLENDLECQERAQKLYNQYENLSKILTNSNVQEVYLQFVQIKESSKINKENVSEMIQAKQSKYSTIISEAEIEKDFEKKNNAQQIYNQYNDLLINLNEENFEEIFSQYTNLTDSIIKADNITNDEK